MIGIYKIVNPLNRVYIGQSLDLNRREKDYKNKHCKTQRIVYNSILKYGWKSHTFEIIHELPSDINQYTLNQYEIFYWQMYKDIGTKLMNIREPGSNGKLSEETKKLIGEKAKKNKYALGYKHSEELISKWKEDKKTFGNPMFGKKHTKQSIIKMVEKRTGDKNHMFGKASKARKKIVQINSQNYFLSISIAADYFKVTRKTIRDWISKNYLLKYADQ